MSASPAADVLLYYARIGGATQVAALELLVGEDLDRLPLNALPRRRDEYLTSRALLRFALQQCTGRPARSHRLKVRANGKPECVDGPPFSLSHSGHWAVCAIALAGEIGVDVQVAAERRRSTSEIAKQHFSPREHEWLRGQPRDRFYMLWVLKEAYLKTTGFGLAGGLDALECRVEPPVIAARIPASTAQPALGLYSLGGEAFLGVATIGCHFAGVRAEAWEPAGADARVAPIRVIARTT